MERGSEHESLVNQTLERLNAGETLYEILDAVRPPEALAAKPYLKPVYDEPEFIVRNLWRCFGGRRGAGKPRGACSARGRLPCTDGRCNVDDVARHLWRRSAGVGNENSVNA